jgi:lipid-binding SYLF domain-containing protein
MKNKHLMVFLRFVGVMGCILSISCVTKDSTTQIKISQPKKKQIAADSRAALAQLYIENPKSRELGAKAKGVLVFPSITKGGRMFGGVESNGGLVVPDGSILDFYQTSGLSDDLQNYGYALFLMDSEAYSAITRADGWEIGSSQNLVIVDQLRASTKSAATIQHGACAFIFNQHGLMSIDGLKGARISRINPSH